MPGEMTKGKPRIAHLQPMIPHYREEFFSRLGDMTRQDIYTFESDDLSKAQSFNIGSTAHKHIACKSFRGFLLYNPLPLLRGDYDVLVLMLHIGHITTWLLLLTKLFHRKKIILWGQGISVKRYLKEERKPDWKMRLQMSLADGVWLYMEKERQQWSRIFPHKPMTALNNTLTGVEDMARYKPDVTVDDLKKKYGITQHTVLIFCARFENNHRRADLLVETIKRLDPRRFAFIIIGAGKHKPDFTPYANVHDFGAVYDTNVKRELFAVADIYFQPGWVGLSIVEAMAYGKPVFTFRRSDQTLQCVEYSYIQDGWNGMLLDDIDHCITAITTITDEETRSMGEHARELVTSRLAVKEMAGRAMEVIGKVTE